MLDKKNIFHNYYYAKEVLFLGLLLIGIGIKALKITGIIIISFVLFFFRNNLNLDKSNKGDILSPSSSEVINIKRKGNKKTIYTYLSPLDRHFMIAPVDCRVKRIDNKLEKNDQERITVYFEDKNGKEFSLSQIVKNIFKGPGLLGSWVLKLMYDNRIVCFCKKGDVLKKGERWGLIRFGSAMEYNMPLSYKMNMKVGEKYSLGNIIGNMKDNLKLEEKKEGLFDDLFENADISYWLLGATAPLIVFFYGWYRCSNIKTHKDILEFSLFKDSKKHGIDGWLLSHYLFFVLLGYMHPNVMRLSILIGLLWEIFEWWVGVYKPKFLEGIGFCPSPSGAKKRGKVWWYWKWQDPVANTLGFITGKYLRTGRIF